MFKIEIEGKFKMNVSFNLKSLASSGSHKQQIWLSGTIKGERFRIFTKLLISSSELWTNDMAKEDSSYGNIKLEECKAINKRLRAIVGFCNEYANLVVNETLTNEPIEHTAGNFKKFMDTRINGDSWEKNKIDIRKYILNFIEQKTKMLNKHTKRRLVNGTIYNHKNAYNRLQDFCKDRHIHMTWNMFTQKFEIEFTDWMCNKGYSANTISNQFSIMKVWLKEAEVDGLIKDKYFHSFPTKVYNVENIYLTEDEITRLYNLDFSSEEIYSQISYFVEQGSHIEETRDLFIVACWTGLRFGDWKNLCEVADIGEDYMTVHTHKTNKEVIIPLHPQAKAIIKKYNGKLPNAVNKTRTIAHIRLCAKMAGIDTPTSLCKVKGGKSVIAKGPKYQFIMNHTCRRSLCTNLYLKGVPTISIMAISGHTSEENFMKYIKVDRKEHAKIVAKAFND